MKSRFIKNYFNIFLISILFPYINIIKTNTDIQPYSFLLGLGLLVLFLLKGKLRISKRQVFFLLIPVIVALLFLVNEPNFNSARGAYGYVAFLVLYIVSFELAARGYTYSNNVLFSTIITYGVAGLIQLFYSPSFFHNLGLLSREQGYAGFQGRGVESLTAEPTYYGFILLLLAIMMEINKDKNKDKMKKYVYVVFTFAIFAQLILISKSSSALLTLALSFPIIFLNKKRITILFKILTIIIVIFVILLIFVPQENFNSLLENRYISLFSKLLKGSNILEIDPSTSDRFFAIYFSLKLSIESFLIPHGFNAWLDAVYAQIQTTHFEIINLAASDNPRILSYIGSFTFELGIFSLPLLYLLLKPRTQLGMIISPIRLTILTLILLLQAIPVSLPIIPFIFGYLDGRYKFTKSF